MLEWAEQLGESLPGDFLNFGQMSAVIFLKAVDDSN